RKYMRAVFALEKSLAISEGCCCSSRWLPRYPLFAIEWPLLPLTPARNSAAHLKLSSPHSPRQGEPHRPNPERPFLGKALPLLFQVRLAVHLRRVASLPAPRSFYRCCKLPRQSCASLPNHRANRGCFPAKGCTPTENFQPDTQYDPQSR